MRHKRRGAVLVLTIIVLAAITAMLALAMSRERSEFSATVTRIEESKAKIAAMSGVQRALVILSTQAPGLATQLNDWYAEGDTGNTLYRVGNVTFRYQILDGGQFVNLNTAPEIQLQNLNLTTEQVDSLMDWREPGETPRAEGAKDDYYSNLTTPYIAKLGRMDSLDELMLIRGFDFNTLTVAPTQSNTSGATPVPLLSITTVDSYSPNTTATGQVKTNINNASVQQLTQGGVPPQIAAAVFLRRNTGGPFTSMGDVLRVAGMTNNAAAVLIDNFTVGGQPRSEGKINVNTASDNVLQTIPGITSDVAQSIVSRQGAGINALSELFQVSGFTLQLMQSTVDQLTTGSETFLVRVEGQAGSAVFPLEAVISVNNNRAHILKVTEPPLRSMHSLWGWQDTTTNEVVLGDSQP